MILKVGGPCSGPLFFSIAGRARYAIIDVPHRLHPCFLAVSVPRSNIMKNSSLAFVIALIVVSSAFSQAKPNAEIEREIKSLKADKTFSVTFDGNSSKLLAVAENFSNADSNRAGLMAMNFAAGFFYPGSELKSSPEKIMLTFWAMSKKPRFAEQHDLTIVAGGESFEIGGGRYSARARENMEYLNYELPRAAVQKIASASDVKLRLGSYDFALTRGQLKTFADLFVLSEVK